MYVVFIVTGLSRVVSSRHFDGHMEFRDILNSQNFIHRKPIGFKYNLYRFK